MDARSARQRTCGWRGGRNPLSLFFSGSYDKQPRHCVLWLGARGPPGSVWKPVDIKNPCGEGLWDPRWIWSLAGCRWVHEASGASADHSCWPEPVSPSFVQGSWSGVWELCLAGNHWLAVLGKLCALPDHTSEAIALHPPVPCNVITGHPGHARATGVSDGPGKPSKAERGLLPSSRRVSSSRGR